VPEMMLNQKALGQVERTQYADDTVEYIVSVILRGGSREKYLEGQ